MAYWLMKSEPDCYGWDHLVAKGEDSWEGVRNHTAKNHLAAMAVGDEAFFYHSNIGREIVGVMRVCRAPYPDPTAAAGAPWMTVNVKPVARLVRPVTLAEIKATAALADIQLLRQSRLSVAKITDAEWRLILDMAGGLVAA